MTPERWQKVKRVLEESLEVSSAERPEFLDRVCKDDEDLRLECEKLLAFETLDDDLLEQPAVSIISKNITAKKLNGEKIGRYKIVCELGAGGMGAVFLAERSDGAFEQKVALKLIKRGMDSDAILDRFINERQILASLKHPNIAHLIDGGTTDDGLPFFVMEYVEGTTILEFAREQNLDLDRRLNLFRDICAAVSFAHRNLVIHRDLKPSNILVTKDGNVKLLDFGISKILNSNDTDDIITATQLNVFTPEYASPEQIHSRKLTTATDVYSLGVILYELLTGNRPFKTDSKNISKLIRAVSETEPLKPSDAATKDQKIRTSNKTDSANVSLRILPSELRGDLDNIILKALRKEPERRYSSVEQFSEDIHRHQTGLPVLARKDTWNYRSAKFLQRNKLAVAASLLILITLTGGLAATLYQRNKAQKRFNDVRQLANSFLFEFHDAIENLPGSTPARELVVRRALEYLNQLSNEDSNDPQLRRELAAAYEKIGKIQGNSYFSNLGDTDGAMKSYRQSLEIRQKLVADDPRNRSLLDELADSHEGVGDILYTINDLKGGLESYEKALAVREKIVAEEPDNLDYRYALANLFGKRGDISGMEGFPNLGDLPAALESYRRAVEIYKELIKIAPDNNKYQTGYATNLHFFGMLQTTTGDSRGAIINGREAILIFEKLTADNPNNANYQTHLMSALVFMRYPLIEEGQTAEAVDNARRVVRAMEKMSAEDPKNAFVRRSLSVSYNSLGICLLRDGKPQEAIENFRRSLSIVEAKSADDPNNAETLRDLSLTKQSLAEAQMATKEIEAALVNFRQTVSILENRLMSDADSIQIKDNLAICLINIGKILALKGDSNGASEHFRRAMPLAEEAIQSAPLNIRVKSRHALSYLEAGTTLNNLIFAKKGTKNKTDKDNACTYLERSLSLWNEMRKTKTLSLINADRPSEAEKELAECHSL